MQESVDIHDVITKLYNVYLNNFIAKHHKGKIYSLTQTGGLMEVVRRTRSPLYAYRNWLDEYRMRLYRRYKKNISFDELKEALEPLIQLRALNNSPHFHISRSRMHLAPETPRFPGVIPSLYAVFLCFYPFVTWLPLTASVPG